jgi:hypothetical protein
MKLYSNDIQLRTASAAIRSLIGNKDVPGAPHPFLAWSGR